MAVIYWRNRPEFCCSYWPFFSKLSRHPTMNRRNSSVASRLLARRAAALKRHLPHAVEGDDHGVHQARVASRRLREAVPVLTTGVKGTKARKARGKIRRLTTALGTVRELDVTIRAPRRARGQRNAAASRARSGPRPCRERARSAPGRRCSSVSSMSNVSKLDRRLEAIGQALAETGRGLARRARRAARQARQGAGDGDGGGRTHVCAGAAASGADRGQEAPLRDRSSPTTPA